MKSAKGSTVLSLWVKRAGLSRRRVLRFEGFRFGSVTRIFHTETALDMNDVGPGLIFDKGLDGDMMQRMQNHMKQVREEMMQMDDLLQGEGLPMPGMPKAVFPKQELPADDMR